MFPDLTRDDVFRLETPHLWLRWPRASDIPPIRRLGGRTRESEIRVGPSRAVDWQGFILDARARNAGGEGLEMVATRKRTQALVGLIGLRAVGEEALLQCQMDRDDLSEALRAMIEATFAFTDMRRVAAVAGDGAAARLLAAHGFQPSREAERYTRERPARNRPAFAQTLSGACLAAE